MRASTSRVRVRYAETDKMGVVYYANYLVWFEIGRTDLLRTLGCTYQEMEAAGVSLAVIQVDCEYRQPARYDDELKVTTGAKLLSPARIAFDYDIRLPDGTVSAVGRTVHAAINRKGRACRLPASVLAELA